MYNQDKRIVVTLDAGGTHFRFTAIQSNKKITETIEFPSESNNLDKCLGNLVKGFEMIISQLAQQPSAISFAFPGPADYPHGVFPMSLTNFPAFRDGVALGPFLSHHFHLPVFINNDADLFTYGEAIAGMLPAVNQKLKMLGSVKEYHNQIGFILGTGFGFGVTTHQNMYIGDNCCSEIYCLPNKSESDYIVEEGVSARAILRYYAKHANDSQPRHDSYEIFQIAEGTIEGDQKVAQNAFSAFGEVAGYTIAHAICMLDGLIVLGGGLSKSYKYFMPALLQQLRASSKTYSGMNISRIPSYVYNLEDEKEFALFAQGETKTLQVYGSSDVVTIDSQKRLGIAISHIGTSEATSIGAYAFALHEIDKQKQ